MKKILLPNVTLLSASSVNIEATVKALEYSCRKIEFGKVVLLSHEKPPILSEKKFNKIDSKSVQIYI